jgi:hypothetical protein
VLFLYLGIEGFRIIHVSIQHNHLHLIAEVANHEVLTRMMQSFTIRAAHAINQAWGREGHVFKFRYNAKQIKTGRYARNAIAYVLNNWRRHREDFVDGAARKAVIDEYSSAITFTGWTKNRRWRIPDGYEPLPVAIPQTALLQTEWQRFGSIDPYEQPGPPR